MRWLPLLLLAGCATLGQRESTVQLPSGELYRVRCQHDGRLEYQDAAVRISVDNRGRPSIVEGVLNTAVLGWIRQED